jgi:hypothetical protein
MNILAFKMPALALLFKEIFHDAQKSYPPTHPLGITGKIK